MFWLRVGQIVLTEDGIDEFKVVSNANFIYIGVLLAGVLLAISLYFVLVGQVDKRDRRVLQDQVNGLLIDLEAEVTRQRIQLETIAGRLKEVIIHGSNEEIEPGASKDDVEGDFLAITNRVIPSDELGDRNVTWIRRGFRRDTANVLSTSSTYLQPEQLRDFTAQFPVDTIFSYSSRQRDFLSEGGVLKLAASLSEDFQSVVKNTSYIGSIHLDSEKRTGFNIVHLLPSPVLDLEGKPMLDILTMNIPLQGVFDKLVAKYHRANFKFGLADHKNNYYWFPEDRVRSEGIDFKSAIAAVPFTISKHEWTLYVMPNTVRSARGDAMVFTLSTAFILIVFVSAAYIRKSMLKEFGLSLRVNR